MTYLLVILALVIVIAAVLTGLSMALAAWNDLYQQVQREMFGE